MNGKNHFKLYKNWNPIYCWAFNLHALPRNTKHMVIDGQVCFHRWLFAKPLSKIQGVLHAWSVEPRMALIMMWLWVIPDCYTRNEIQFIAEHETYALELPRNTKHMTIDEQICFHRHLFANTVKPLRCIIGSKEPVNGINKDVSDTRLLLTITKAIPNHRKLKSSYCCTLNLHSYTIVETPNTWL